MLTVNQTRQILREMTNFLGRIFQYHLQGRILSEYFVKSIYKPYLPQCGKVLKNAITLKTIREINSSVTFL